MGGFFGVVSKEDCVQDLFYGTDYHSHLGTRRGGLAVLNSGGFTRVIHSIENAQFRSKFKSDIPKMAGNMGIGCISDTDDQPLIISSHLGQFAIVDVGRINNLNDLVSDAHDRGAHFSEMSSGQVSPTEVVGDLVAQGETFEQGIRLAQEAIDGSCSLLILTANDVYAARDRFGRTPLIIGEKEGAYCATMETSALPNLGYEFKHELGPGEVIQFTREGAEQRVPPGDTLQICAFLWIYYGYPASHYEGINVEMARNRCGAALARNDKVEVDMVAGIPDSGIAHAIGYANESRIPYYRPFVKYTPTWPRSFMPQNQDVRNLVARMKLIPIRELIQGKRLLFCEDSVVRGTQFQGIAKLLYNYGATEVHLRPACPPLIHVCPFLNFSQTKKETDLAARKAIEILGGHVGSQHLAEYADPATEQYQEMVKEICQGLGLTSLRYQILSDMLDAIGMEKEKVCTYCWDGVE